MDKNETTDIKEPIANQNTAEVKETSDNSSEQTRKKTSFSHTVRHKDRGTVTIDNYSMAKAIKLNCSECEGFESDPEQCPDKLCPLWPYRGNTQKNRNRALRKAPSPEQVRKMQDALAKSKAAKKRDDTQSDL